MPHRRKHKSDWGFGLNDDFGRKPPRHRRRRSSPEGNGCFAALMLAGIIVYSSLEAISGFLATIANDPEVARVLVLVTIWFVITGLPALVVFAWWAKCQRDHQRRVKLWHWQQRMKRFGAEYGSVCTGPPREWISSLSWADLEQLAGDIFGQLGYQTHLVGRTGDRGIDVRLVAPSGVVEVVQCNQWRDSVGEPVVRDLYGAMMHAKAQQAYLFAPQGFTRPALNFARGKPINLCDRDAICQLVELGGESISPHSGQRPV